MLVSDLKLNTLSEITRDIGQVFFASMVIGPFYNTMINVYILGALLLIAFVLLGILAKKKSQ